MVLLVHLELAVQSTKVPREPFLTTEKINEGEKKISALHADWSPLHASMRCLRQRFNSCAISPPFTNPVFAPGEYTVYHCRVCAVHTLIIHSVVFFKPKKFDFVHQTVSPREGVWSGHETTEICPKLTPSLHYCTTSCTGSTVYY